MRSAPSASFHDLGLVGAEEDQVAVLRAGALDDGRQCLLVKVFHDWRLQAFFAELGDVIDLDIGETTRAIDADELGILVDLAARELRATGHRIAATRPLSEFAGAEKTLNATSLTASVTSVISSVTRRSGLSEPKRDIASA